MNFECSYLEDSVPCGVSASEYRNLPLCPVHQEIVYALSERDKRSTALQSSGFHRLDEFPGYCYFGLLPDGTVKIGYSNTSELLRNRFKSLSRTYKSPVLELAVIRGGFVAEAVMHDRFKADRIPGKGERFRYTPDLATFLAGLGPDELVEI